MRETLGQQRDQTMLLAASGLERSILSCWSLGELVWETILSVILGF